MEYRVELTISDDIKAAPRNTTIWVWGNGPWRVAILDANGQWRNRSGTPIAAPKAWAMQPDMSALQP